MKSAQLLEEIRETNLTYLLLAQQMLRDDRDAAMYRLGISPDVADILDNLTPAQVTRMAMSNTLLCRFRCDDRSILGMLSGYGDKGRRLMGPSHAAILMAGAAPAAAA